MDIPAQRPAVPFTVLVQTLYGPMLVNRYDIDQTNPLFKAGIAADHNEIAVLAHVLQACKPDRVVIDVGANIGAFTFGLAPFLGSYGRLHAFEPQRLIYNMLAGSIALNSFTNVYSYNLAVGDHEGTIEVPQFDYFRPMNFGSIEFGPEQQESLPQIRAHDPGRFEQVELTTLDRFGWPRVDLLKIDVEGMELEVIRGAKGTIERYRPILYVEFLKSDVAALRQVLCGFGCEVFKVGISYLAIPREMEGPLSRVRNLPPGPVTVERISP